MDKKVEVISENLPRKTNFRIMDLLIQEASWKIASDTNSLSHKSFIETNEQKIQILDRRRQGASRVRKTNCEVTQGMKII